MASLSTLDPRVKRTRQLLEDALLRLLERKTFDEISVQDLTEEATLNRATFYAHYPDKFALLQSTTASKFLGLLESRGVRFDGTCGSALRKIFLGICDYLAGTVKGCPTQHRPMDPYMESSIILAVREMVLDGLKKQGEAAAMSSEMVAAMVSSALYGAAKEWLLTSERVPAESIVEAVVTLVSPLLHSKGTSTLGSPAADPLRQVCGGGLGSSLE